MAQYEHLQIYRDAFQYLIYCETIVKNFPRYHKYTHGTDLRNNARMNIKLIIRANNLFIKSPVLEELRVNLEESKLLIRICKEVKAFQYVGWAKSFLCPPSKAGRVSGSVTRQLSEPYFGRLSNHASQD